MGVSEPPFHSSTEHQKTDFREKRWEEKVARCGGRPGFWPGGAERPSTRKASLASCVSMDRNMLLDSGMELTAGGWLSPNQQRHSCVLTACAQPAVGTGYMAKAAQC